VLKKCLYRITTRDENFAGKEGTGSVVDSEDKREAHTVWMVFKKKCKQVLNHTRREQFQSVYI